MNREWINKQGDFFVESPINFVTAIIWFLKKYADGKYCTLPHVIELMQADYEELFPVLNTQPEIEVLVNPFITAYQNDAMEQLEGQVASAKIGMARLASPQLYWVLSGNDFTLDINNPKHPKIVCMGNNPEKQQIYGAVLSLYISRLVRQVNKKGMLKSSLVFDEFPTIYFNNMDSLIATARSNKVATTLAMQDFSQLRKDYGKEQADVIVNIAGNIISGQVMGRPPNFYRNVSEKSCRTGKAFPSTERIPLSISILLYPIVRPRSGNYFYSHEEFAILKNDIKICRELGCDGIWVGVQSMDATIDKERFKQIIEWAGPMGVTCNRVFDCTPDPFQALEDIIEIGCERVLTSGQKCAAPDTAELLSRLVQQASSRISIMPGAGVKSSNLKRLKDECNAFEYHSSARKIFKNPLTYINTEVSDYGNVYIADALEVRAMIEVLEEEY